MGQLNIPEIKTGRTDQETISSLITAYAILRKQLLFLTENLDSDNVTEINTNITTVKSNKGYTKITGPQLIMNDNNGTQRIIQGLDAATLNFVYEMFNKAGNLTVSVDSETGNIIVNEGTFKGDIQTDKDIKVGNNINIGNITQADTAKKIVFYSNGENQCQIEKDANDDLRITSFKEMYIDSFMDMTIGSLQFLSLNGHDGFALITVNPESTEFAKLAHNGSGNFTLGHEGTGQVLAQGTWDCSGATFTGLDVSGYATRSWSNGQFQPKITGASGSFTSANGKTVTVSNGIITSII